MTNNEKIGQELKMLEKVYRQRFPNAQEFGRIQFWGAKGSRARFIGIYEVLGA
jgi:hypothetical protein